MKINIVERKINLTDSTKEKLENKLSKFDKFFKTDAEATATFKTQKDKVFLEVCISAGDMLIRAEADDPDAKSAIDKIDDIIVGQFRKYKTKLEKKIKTNAYEDNSELFGNYSLEDEETEFKVVKSKKFFVKPMSVDEAILQMNLIGHQFFVFTNSETEQTCIVYKRKDRNYGLIEVD